MEESGAALVLVTGRPPRWMPPIATALGHHGLCICANGAVLYDLHTATVVGHSLLEAEAAREVIAAMRRDIPGITFAVERHDSGFAHEPAYRPRWDSADPLQVLAVEELVSTGVVKLLARHEGMAADELLAVATAAVGAAGTLTHSSHDGLLEISAAGVTKASGLAAYAEDRGIAAAEVVAFGDMPNDLPMLAWAGRSYAVANAHPEVLALADEVVPSNDDDGVAQTLARWF